MKIKIINLAMASVMVVAPAFAEEGESLPPIQVEGKKLEDVSGEQVKSADLAEALNKNVPNISIVRRSGIANDIILRGQKKDNINILIDDAKIYGACPNRMDPPTSHVVNTVIDGVEVTEGPYDVENFGTLSGAVKITTRKPEKGFDGELNANVGSWNYRKGAGTASGGGDIFRLLVTASKEQSGQYEDGDGNNFAEQIDEFVGAPGSMVTYKDKYRDMDAYEKTTFMGKAYFDITDHQELMVSYTANRSDDILYPSTPMDALYDDSNIFNAEYTLEDLASFSKELKVQYYKSDVDHPMSNFYRNSSGPDSVNEKTHALTTDTQGLKIMNSLDINDSTELTFGVDTSVRNWDGKYEGEGMQAPIDGIVSIDDVDTTNRAVFAEIDKDFDRFNLKLGARYDSTSIDPDGGAYNEPSNDYTSFGGFVFGTYQLAPSAKVFAGLGRASRVPDARELYLHGSMINMGMPMSPQIGTPDLDQTTNNEIDLGMENDFENLTIKTKLFYSWLKNYIHYRATPLPGSMMNVNRFENIDATIYGLDISGTYFATNDLYLDFGVAYQRGQKDEALPGQSDKDLAEIPPTKLNMALNYDYMPNSSARFEMIAADSWDTYDEDNGEQELDSYAVFNFRVSHRFAKYLELTLGVDNIFDETYAVTNTYKDLTLLSGGVDDPVMLINEPGRYMYLNATVNF